MIEEPRQVNFARLTNLEELPRILNDKMKENIKYDFIIINLRKVIRSENQLREFLQIHSTELFGVLRELLTDERYGALITSYDGTEHVGLPLPWTLSYAMRSHLKLRDEKIGIIENQNEVFYCIFFQAVSEQVNSRFVTLDQIVASGSEREIPLWTMPKPPPRSKDEVYHPAKFPESLVGAFIELFTKPGDLVLDPMAGTGSALVAAAQLKRNAIGVELNPAFVEIAKKRIEKVNPAITLFEEEHKLFTKIYQGDAQHLESIHDLDSAKPNYCITSPPYWSILHNTGSEYQRARKSRKLLQTYSSDSADLSNITVYSEFLDALKSIYTDVGKYLLNGGFLTVIVKNVKRDHTVYPLAWDLVKVLCQKGEMYEYVGNTFWLQDDVPLKPFAVGIHWVSNTVHQYCLHFRKR